jgi:hypothetical protein
MAPRDFLADVHRGDSGPGLPAPGRPDLLGDAAPHARQPVRRRLAVTTVGVLVAGVGMLALRAGTEPVERSAAAPRTPVARPNVYARAYLQDPPFDRLPGRTPIPKPTTSRDRHMVDGPLPAVGDRTPGPITADLATRLVLGRYCRCPASLGLLVQPLADDWTRVSTRASRDGQRPAFVDVRLTWNAKSRAYDWTGAIAQLDSCS